MTVKGEKHITISAGYMKKHKARKSRQRTVTDDVSSPGVLLLVWLPDDVRLLFIRGPTVSLVRGVKCWALPTPGP